MANDEGIGHDWEYIMNPHKYERYKCKKCGEWFSSSVYAAPSAEDYVIVSGKWLTCEEAQARLIYDS